MTRLTAGDLAALLHGSARAEPGVKGGWALHRLPTWAREQVDDPLFGWVQRCAPAARLRFVTPADHVTLELATMTARLFDAPADEPARLAIHVRDRDGNPPVQIVELPDGDELLLNPDLTRRQVVQRPPARVDIDLNRSRDRSAPVEVWLPHNRPVELVGLSADADISPAAPEAGPRWVHYGSSISHGMNAPSPDRTWPAQAARHLGWRLHDLSFSGNAQLDGFVARMIRDTPADIITLKVGINLVNADSMRERSMRPALHAFLDTIREHHETTPIVLITAVACPIHEDRPGPVVVETATGLARVADRRVDPDPGALTLAATRRIVRDVHMRRSTRDPYLRLLEGTDLFGPDEAHLLYDNLHPSSEGLDLIAARFTRQFLTTGRPC